MSPPRRPLFGVAGNPPHFWESPFKGDRANAPDWLKTIGLDALEIQCGRGVRMPPERSQKLRANAERCGIALSVHAPYYISLGTSDRHKIDNSITEIRKSIDLAQRLGTRRVILHLGSVEEDRSRSTERAIAALRAVEPDCRAAGVTLYPEVIGKVKQLGSLEDVLEVCSKVEHTRPCIDFAHLHARTSGSLRTRDDFSAVLDEVHLRLGASAFVDMHVHFYPIEWNENGEVRHRAFDDVRREPEQLVLIGPKQPQDAKFFPRYEPFLEVVRDRSLRPTVICEAKDSQDVGALMMKSYFDNISQRRTDAPVPSPTASAGRRS